MEFQPVLRNCTLKMYPQSLGVHLFFCIFALENKNQLKVKIMAKNIFKLNFSLKSQSDKSKPALIYIMWTFDKRYKVSTSLSVIPEFWDAKNHSAIISSTQTQVVQRSYKRVNRLIAKMCDKILNGLYAYICQERTSINGIALKNEIVNVISKIETEEKVEEEKKSITPFEYFKNYCDNVCNKTVKRTGTFRCKGTQTNHYSVLSRYKCFIEYTHKIDSFDLFDEKFEEDFERYSLQVKGHTPNTVAASFSVMKIWLTAAEKEGLIKDTAFHHYKTKASSPSHQYLNDDEIQRIYNIQFSKELKAQYHIDLKSQIEDTRDLFVVACNLGLRLGDWNNLNNAVWDFDNNVVDIITTKTKERVVIPISTMVKEIYNKYNGKFPKVWDKTSTNRHIQDCCRIAGIDNDVYQLETIKGVSVRKKYKKYELITSHSARRSFATNLYLKCKNAKMVMSFTGHTTEENFFKYICVSKQENAQMAQQFFK